jgi:hypothetical protein
MHEPIVKNAILPKNSVQKINVKNIREIRDFPGILENLKNQNSREFSSRESEMHTSSRDLNIIQKINNSVNATQHTEDQFI